MRALPLLALAACSSVSKPDDASPPEGDAADSPARDPDGSAPDGPAPDGNDADSGDSGSDDSGAPDADTADAGVPAPCTSWSAPVATGTVADAALDELSDLVPSRRNPGLLWSHEDSGGAAELYALDASGARLGTLAIAGATNRDWEDLAIAPCPDGGGDCLWIGDTGDNGLSRDDVAVLVVPEPAVTSGFEAEATPTTYRYAFPDGRGNVEGLGVGPDGLPVLVTKRVDATAEVYRFPTLDPEGTVTLGRLGAVVTGDPSDEHPAEATSADVRADGGALLVRTYGFLREFPLDGGLGDGFALPAPEEGQGEAAAYDADGSVWLVSEGEGSTLWHVPCAEAG